MPSWAWPLLPLPLLLLLLLLPLLLLLILLPLLLLLQLLYCCYYYYCCCHCHCNLTYCARRHATACPWEGSGAQASRQAGGKEAKQEGSQAGRRAGAEGWLFSGAWPGRRGTGNDLSKAEQGSAGAHREQQREHTEQQRHVHAHMYVRMHPQPLWLESGLGFNFSAPLPGLMSKFPAKAGRLPSKGVVKLGRPEKVPILVILEIDGVLLFRSWTGSVAVRPCMEEFLATLFVELEGRVRVAVWSSARLQFLAPLVCTVFGQWSKHLEFVAARNECTQCWANWGPEAGRPFIRKELFHLYSTKWRQHMPDRVLLIDDEPSRCAFNDQGAAVHPTTWKYPRDRDCTELRRLAEYLKELVGSDYESARDFVLLNPFNKLCPMQDSGGEEASESEQWASLHLPATFAKPV